jgi:hypothetical protein
MLIDKQKSKLTAQMWIKLKNNPHTCHAHFQTINKFLSCVLESTSWIVPDMKNIKPFTKTTRKSLEIDSVKCSPDNPTFP